MDKNNWDVESSITMQEDKQFSRGVNSYLKMQKSTPIDGLKIYIRATSRLLEALQEVKKMGADYEIKSKSLSPKLKSEAIQINSELLQKLNWMKTVCNEFVKGFSVVHDERAKELMLLCLSRFNYIVEQIDLYAIFKRPEYLDNMQIMLGRLDDSFKKMLEIYSAGIAKKAENHNTQSEKAEISV